MQGYQPGTHVRVVGSVRTQVQMVKYILSFTTGSLKDHIHCTTGLGTIPRGQVTYRTSRLHNSCSTGQIVMSGDIADRLLMLFASLIFIFL